MGFILRPTLAETFLARIAESADQTAFWFRKNNLTSSPLQPLTFSEFYSRCRDLSYGLMAAGVKQGDKVILLSQSRIEWSLLDLAIIGAQGITVPISPSLVPKEMAAIALHCDATFIIAENQELLDKLSSGAPNADEFKKRFSRTFCIDPSLDSLIEEGRPLQKKSPARFVDQLHALKPSDLFTICYTSGTTGAPKGVMLTHDSLMSVLEDCVAVLGKHLSPQTEKELALSVLPFSHVLGRVESMAVYAFGWQQVFSGKIENLLEDLKKTKPTVLFAVPRIFDEAHRLIQRDLETQPKWIREIFDWATRMGSDYFAAVHSRKAPSSSTIAKYLFARKVVFKPIADRFGGNLKFSICGGAPLSSELGAMAQILGLRILEGYGLTETCAPVTLNVPGQTRFGSVGKPLPEVTLKIAEDGEILVQSRKVFKGYYKDPQETERVIQGGWFYTGDIGHIDRDGFLRITDRKKDIIVTSGGRTILPQKIEAEIKKHPWIKQVVVHGNTRSYLTALLTLDPHAVLLFAKEHQILFSEYRELIKNQRILRVIQEALDQVNQGLPRVETIRKFVILPNEFTVESGELTPALKVKRSAVDLKYRALLDSLYPPPPAPLAPHSGPPLTHPKKSDT